MSENKQPAVSDAVAALFDSVSSGAASNPDILPNAAAIARAAKEIDDVLNSDDPSRLIGQVIEGKGVYFGRYEPKDSQGKSLGKIFNLFAAPEDLPETMDYLDTVKQVAILKNWHGHDGTDYALDNNFRKALKEGSYDGGWIIPPRELLAGTAADGPEGMREGKSGQPDNLFVHQNTGAFKKTFTVRAGEAGLRWYWSSSELQSDPFVWFAGFSDGYESYLPKDKKDPLGCRLVRLEPVYTSGNTCCRATSPKP